MNKGLHAQNYPLEQKAFVVLAVQLKQVQFDEYIHKHSSAIHNNFIY